METPTENNKRPATSEKDRKEWIAPEMTVLNTDATCSGAVNGPGEGATYTPYVS